MESKQEKEYYLGIMKGWKKIVKKFIKETKYAIKLTEIAEKK